MGGRGEDQTDEDAVLLAQSLQNVISLCDAERTREEIVARYIHYNQHDSYFQRRILYVEEAISKNKLRMKCAAARIRPIREE